MSHLRLVLLVHLIYLIHVSGHDVTVMWLVTQPRLHPRQLGIILTHGLSYEAQKS